MLLENVIFFVDIKSLILTLSSSLCIEQRDPHRNVH